MKKLFLISWMVVSLSSCAHDSKTASTVSHSGNLNRLMGLQDAEIARDKAPVFTKDALQTVNALETEIKELKVK